MEELAQGAAGNVISLLFGHPDPVTLMTPEFQGAIQTLLAQPQSYKSLQYGLEAGTPSLIQYLVDRLNREQALALTPANLMITAGSTHAVDMLARLYARQGGVVIVEAPSYADSLHVFRDYDIELCSVPMDENGLITSELKALLEGHYSENKYVSLLYTIPNFHNPTGITASIERRREVIELARQYEFLIVEDDVYHDLGFESAVPPSYYSLMEGQQVMSIGSFSKTLAPGLRLGWLVSAPEVIENCVNCGTTQMGGGANPFAAQMVAEYCRTGHWEAHIASLRAIYEARCSAALAALEKYMPAGVSWTRPVGGFFVWLYLPQHVFAQDVKRLALEQGVTLAAGEGFFANPPDGAHNLRLAFSFAPLADIEKGIRVVGEVIAALVSVGAKF